MSFAEALHRPFYPTRRAGLKEGPAGAAAVIYMARNIPADAGKRIVDFLLTTPIKERRETPTNPFAPGAIEANIESPFIQKQYGHLSWLREAVFENSHVLTIAQDVSAKLAESLAMQKEMTPGEMVKAALQSGKEVVAPFAVSFSDNARNLEYAHAGLIALSAPTMPWLTGKEFVVLQLPVENYQSTSQFLWGTGGLGTVVFPPIFGVDKPGVDKPLVAIGKEPQYNGKDRTVHFTQYALLAFEYLYAKHYDLAEQQAIPNGLAKILDVMGAIGFDNDAKTEVLAQAAGIGYEVQGTLTNANNRPFPFGKNRDNISEGVFDPMVAADIKANILGMLTGIALFRRAESGEPINAVFEELNDPKWRKFETLPYLQSANPKYVGGKEMESPKNAQLINFLLNKYTDLRS